MKCLSSDFKDTRCDLEPSTSHLPPSRFSIYKTVTASLTSCNFGVTFRVWGPLCCPVLVRRMLQRLGTSWRLLQPQEGDSEIPSQGTMGGYWGAALVEELGEPETPGHRGWQEQRSPARGGYSQQRENWAQLKSQKWDKTSWSRSSSIGSVNQNRICAARRGLRLFALPNIKKPKV